MNDYIKREDALNDAETIDPKYSDLISQIKNIINAQPPADVVEIVRCKDCKYWHDDGIMTTCDKNIGNGYDAEYYCADGERKDGDNE